MSLLSQREAAEIREEWLAWAFSTLPADRAVAEEAISGLYRLIGLEPPRFHWVASPVNALLTVPPGTPEWQGVERVSRWRLPREFSHLVAELCGGLDERLPFTARPLNQQLTHMVRGPLARSVDGVLVEPFMAAHDVPDPRRLLWYRTLCVSWPAHYDVLRRRRVIDLGARQEHMLGLWVAAAGACGWWWPQERVCVVSERPAVVRTEVGSEMGGLRAHCPDGPALRYADGWDAYAWHGTPVPSWVIDDPPLERIEAETNVEVRRCAIERIGWPAYAEGAGLRLVASAPDPGNPGSELRLFDLRGPGRLLVAVNGSAERDGRRRRYGLTVPRYFDDPVAAAGWTYGLSAEQYSLLLRRT